MTNEQKYRCHILLQNRSFFHWCGVQASLPSAPCITPLGKKKKKKIRRSISHFGEGKHGFGNLAPDTEHFNYSSSWPSQTAAQFSALYQNFSWNQHYPSGITLA